MKYTIECSFGEIIDKITILEIKKSKSTEREQTENIAKELDHLRKYCLKDDTFLELYKELFSTNRMLWVLEDIIREKSRKKEFDKTYIQTAENIHVTNDKRFNIKKTLNELVGSEFKEYKFYKSSEDNIKMDAIPTEEETSMLEYSKKLYINNKFTESFAILEKLILRPHTKVTDFIAEIYFSHKTAARMLGINNLDIVKIDSIGRQLDVLFTDDLKKMHYKINYGFILLEKKRYLESANYIKYMQSVSISNSTHNIHADNMSYFQQGDKDKTLLIYSSGGIGDIIMYTRFLRRVCETQSENHIVFIINDCLAWMYHEIFKDVANLLIVLDSKKTMFLPKYDYHTSMIMLMIHLRLDYKDIYIDYFLEKLPKTTLGAFGNIVKLDKLNICFNWHGSYANSCEKYNRGTSLSDWIPLFKMKNVRWISLQKVVSKKELAMLKRYGVVDLHDTLDENPDFAFRDTISILKAVDFMITTDTSLLHIAGTANISNCWAILPIAADWRWTDDITTNWYPNIKMFRQKKALDWSNVMDDLFNEISKVVNLSK